MSYPNEFASKAHELSSGPARPLNDSQPGAILDLALVHLDQELARFPRSGSRVLIPESEFVQPDGSNLRHTQYNDAFSQQLAAAAASGHRALPSGLPDPVAAPAPPPSRQKHEATAPFQPEPPATATRHFIAQNQAEGRHMPELNPSGLERKLATDIVVDRAVIIPAHNEENTIANVIEEVFNEQPDAVIVVVCNACSDDTFIEAKKKLNSLKENCRFVLLREDRKGKAKALRTGMAAVHARVYAWIDADQTYPAASLAPMFYMVESNKCDMVTGDRISTGAYDKQNGRPGHSFGNRMVRKMLNICFPSVDPLRDPMTGLRVMSASVADAYAMTCNGFEVEVDISAFCLKHNIRVIETPIDYFNRPEGSQSKLNTYQDGVRVICNMLKMTRLYRPLAFFGAIAGLFFLMSVMSGSAPIVDFIQTGLVIHMPRAILATGLAILGFISLCCGVILDSITDAQSRAIEREFTRNKRFISSLKLAR